MNWSRVASPVDQDREERRTDVVAAVVAFEPTEALLDLCTVLAADDIPVMVVDNASANAAQWTARVEATGARVVRLPRNLGVSGALAVAHSRALDARWLLTFDQDSVVSPGFVTALLQSPHAADPTVAMVGCIVVDSEDGASLQDAPVPGKPGVSLGMPSIGKPASAQASAPACGA